MHYATPRNTTTQKITFGVAGLFLVAWCLPVKSSSVESAYNSLAARQFSNAAVLFEREVNRLDADCPSNKEQFSAACLDLSLASAGLAQVRLEQKDLGEAYRFFARAYEALSIAEQQYLSSLDVAPTLSDSATKLPTQFADQLSPQQSQQLQEFSKNLNIQFKEEMEEAKLKQKELIQEMLNMDVEAELKNSLQESEIPPEAHDMIAAGLSQEWKQRGFSNANNVFPEKIKDAKFAAKQARSFEFASQHICLKETQPRAPDDRNRLLQLAANQRIYIEQTQRRVSIRRQVDEAEDMIISDVLLPSNLKYLIALIERSRGYTAGRSMHTKAFAESIRRCVAGAENIAALGITKATEYGFANRTVLSDLYRVSQLASLQIAPSKVHELVFMQGFQQYRTGDKATGKKQMEVALKSMSEENSPLGVGDDSFISQIKPLLYYVQVVCADEKPCLSEIEERIIDQLEDVLDAQEKLLKGKRAFREMLTGMMKQKKDYSVLKKAPGGYALGSGVYARLAEMYYVRLAELAAAETLLSLHNLPRAENFLVQGRYKDWPETLYSPTLLAYQYFLKAKFAAASDNIQNALEHWQRAVQEYEASLPLIDIYMGFPRLYETPTQIYEDAARFCIDHGYTEQAIGFLEKARQHSLAGKPLPDFVTDDYLAQSRATLLNQYRKILEKGAGGDHFLLDFFTYNSHVKSSVPGVSDIFYLADALSFLPNLEEREALLFARDLAGYEWFRSYRGLHNALVPNARLPKHPEQRLPLPLTSIQKQLLSEHQVFAIWQTPRLVFIYTIGTQNMDASYRVLGQSTTTELVQDATSAIIQQRQAPLDHAILLVNGELSQLPLAKLLREHQALPMNTSISFSPSLMTLGRRAERSRSTSATLVSPKLPNRQKIVYSTELSALNKLATTTALVGQYATRNGLKQALEDSLVVHLATHARLDPLNPEFSYIALNNGQDGTDKLYNHQLTDFSFGGVSLVVLNACETSTLSSFFINNEFASLQSSVLAAGAGSVVASISDVDDRIAASFTEQLYAQLALGQPLYRAFDAAQRQLQNQYPDSEQWSNYTLSGRYDTVTQSLHR